MEPVAGFPSLQYAAGCFRRRFFAALFLRRLPAGLAAALFCGGGVLLLIRLSGATFSHHPVVQWGIPVVFPAIAVLLTGISAGRRLPARSRFVAGLDAASRAGGLFCAMEETAPGPWGECLPPVRVPVFRRPPLRIWIPPLAGLLFLGGAELVPVSESLRTADYTLDLSAEQAALQQQLDVLAEERLLPEPELRDLQNAVEDLRRHDNALEPGRGYELADALSRRLEHLTETLQHDQQRQLEELRLLDTAADRLAAGADGGADRAEAHAQFNRLLERLAEENEGLARSLSECDAPDGSCPPEEKLRQLSKRLQHNARLLEHRLSRLNEACRRSGASPAAQESTGSSGTANPDKALSDFLAAHAPEAAELNEAVCRATAGSPGGTGAIQRGRADAFLNFTGETAPSGAIRKDLALEGGASTDDDTLLARFAAAPQTGDIPQAAPAPGRLEAAPGAVRKSGRPVHPEHRTAVRRYFQQPSQPRGNP